VDIIQLCASKRCSEVEGQSPYSRNQGAKPLEAKKLLVFGAWIKAANLPVLNI